MTNDKARLTRLGLALNSFYSRHIPSLAILFLFPVSCWSTYSGIRELMRSTETISDLEGLLVSIGLTLGIQLTLLSAVAAIMKVRGRAVVLYLSIYVLTVFFSVLFGYAFYFRHLRAEDFAREVHVRESDRMVAEAQNFLVGFDTVSRRLGELADYSATRSDRESRFGGTCGDDSPQGRGPRARGRHQDAGLFDGYQGDFRTIGRTCGDQIALLRGDLAGYQATNAARHQDVLKTFHQELNRRAIEASFLLKEVQDYLRSRFPAGRYTIRDAGITFLCRDERMEHLAGQILASEVPRVPSAPERFEAHRPKVVVHYALGRLLNWVSAGGWAGPASGNTPTNRKPGRPADCDEIPGGTQTPAAISERAASPEEALPLLLGVLVDLLILLSVLAVGPDRRGAREGRR